MMWYGSFCKAFAINRKNQNKRFDKQNKTYEKQEDKGFEYTLQFVLYGFFTGDCVFGGICCSVDFKIYRHENSKEIYFVFVVVVFDKKYMSCVDVKYFFGFTSGKQKVPYAAWGNGT